MDDILSIDFDSEIARISDGVQQALRSKLHRRGLVVAISGGIDSSVSAALAVNAVGKKKVFGVLMPEMESSPDSLNRGTQLAKYLGIDYVIQDIGATLRAIGCYEERDIAIQSVFSDYKASWKNKIVISGGLDGGINHFKLVVQEPNGETHSRLLPLEAYLKIVAATNYKQRIRKTIEYFHADKLNYAVVGTPNRLEYDQGFFVKNGDGSADIKPIAHLYKSQVYGLARYMGLPEEICSAIPTTDTYTLEQGQDEFYFALPYQKMDVAVLFYNQGRSASELAGEIGIDEGIAHNVYKDIENKRKTTKYLHENPVLIEPVLP
jgi:NAD+ synthase